MSSSVVTPTAAPHLRTWLPRVALAILIPVLLLALVEGAMRLSNVGVPLNPTRPCQVDGKVAVCDNFAFAAVFLPPGMLRTPRPYAFGEQKPANTYRIAVLGESAAYGDPDPAYGFSRYMDVMLRKRYPGVNFEVINTSITATNSHAMLPIIRDMVHHQTDLFIVYTGSNEVVGPFGAGTVFTSTNLPLPLIRANIWLNGTRIGQFVNRQRAADPKTREQWRGMEMFLSNQIPADSPALNAVYRNFEANMRDSISAARSGGAQVLVSTVVTNLKDCAPFASAHKKDLKPEALQTWEQLAQQGAALEGAGDFQGALQAYRKAAEIDSSYAELHFRMARCLSALGDNAAALQAFQRSRDLDTLRFRTDTRINDIARNVANSAGQGVKLVDAERVFADASPRGIIGSELLCDHVHFVPEGNYLIARAMFDQIATMLPPEMQSKAAGEVASEEECERLLALTKHDRTRITQENLERLQHPPFTTQLNHQEQMMRLAMQMGADEMPNETAQQYQWAITQSPQDRVLHLNFGRFLSRYNRQAAINEFRQSRPYNDVPFILPDGSVLQ